MANTDEEKQRERLELLKMKQGIISESELIPEEPEKQPNPPMTAAKKISNFFYYNKLKLLLGAAVIIVLVFLVMQIVMRENPDIEVLVIGTQSASPLASDSQQIELALEQYCQDFNGDGKVHVGVTSIDLDPEGTAGQYQLAQTQIFQRELKGNACIIISDNNFLNYMTNELEMPRDAFKNISDKADNSQQYCIAVTDTVLSSIINEFPENAYVYFLTQGRDEAVVADSETLLDAIIS